jgi:hypothetical protein
MHVGTSLQSKGNSLGRKAMLGEIPYRRAGGPLGGGFERIEVCPCCQVRHYSLNVSFVPSHVSTVRSRCTTERSRVHALSAQRTTGRRAGR